MSPKDGFEILQAVYAAYDELMAGSRFACRPGCATCCSVNVVVTSLEADYLRQAPAWSDARLVRAVEEAARRPRYIPAASTNLVAACCLAGREPPPDPSPHRPGSCPLLDGRGLCRVYDHRPFACRSMGSRTVCAEGGEAVMAPLHFTFNLALCQVIEHLDPDGRTGNLLDMLTCTEVAPSFPPLLVANRPLPGFLVPPEEAEQFRAMMTRLLDRPVGSTTLADHLPRLF